VNKTVGGVTNNASRVTGGVVGGGQRALGGVTGNASKVTGGVVGRANSTAGGLIGGGTKALGGVTGGVVGGGQKALGGVTNSATKSIPPFKGPSSTPVPNKTFPKPYPNANGLPKPNNAPAYPGSDRKAPVKPGMPKPFTPPIETKKLDTKKPYPGTSTLPGQSKVPVQNQRLKPLPRLAPQVGQGQSMTHIAI
jgi:hypothetical protein